MARIWQRIRSWLTSAPNFTANAGEQVERVDLADRFAGCLLGQAVGDAVGFMVEGQPINVCRDYVKGRLRPMDLADLSRGAYKLGQYTDDTQLARELAISIVEQNGFNADAYAQRIAAMFRDHRMVGRGRATTEAAERLLSGVHWSKAGAPSPAAGNGSAMRAAPIGLMYHANPRELRSAAMEQSRITHQDPRCLAGSVAIAGAVSLALHGMVAPISFCQQLAEWCAPLDIRTAQVLGTIPTWLRLDAEVALEEISAIGSDPSHPGRWSKISPFVISSVAWALYVFLRSPHDYWETVCTAVAGGGDTDTTAAMAGAISGALNGVSVIPVALRRLLNDRGEGCQPELIELAWRLLGTALSKSMDINVELCFLRWPGSAVKCPKCHSDLFAGSSGDSGFLVLFCNICDFELKAEIQCPCPKCGRPDASWSSFGDIECPDCGLII
jgi:ADP-ribosylglycohydrolase